MAYTEYHSVTYICEESDKSHLYLLTHSEARIMMNKKRTPLLRETNPKYNETYRDTLTSVRNACPHACPNRPYDLYHSLRDRTWGHKHDWSKTDSMIHDMPKWFTYYHRVDVSAKDTMELKSCTTLKRTVARHARELSYYDSTDGHDTVPLSIQRHAQRAGVIHNCRYGYTKGSEDSFYLTYKPSWTLTTDVWNAWHVHVSTFAAIINVKLSARLKEDPIWIQNVPKDPTFFVNFSYRLIELT